MRRSIGPGELGQVNDSEAADCGKLNCNRVRPQSQGPVVISSVINICQPGSCCTGNSNLRLKAPKCVNLPNQIKTECHIANREIMLAEQCLHQPIVFHLVNLIVQLACWGGLVDPCFRM